MAPSCADRAASSARKRSTTASTADTSSSTRLPNENAGFRSEPSTAGGGRGASCFGGCRSGGEDTAPLVTGAAGGTRGEFGPRRGTDAVWTALSCCINNDSENDAFVEPSMLNSPASKSDALSELLKKERRNSCYKRKLQIINIRRYERVEKIFIAININN